MAENKIGSHNEKKALPRLKSKYLGNQELKMFTISGVSIVLCSTKITHFSMFFLDVVIYLHLFAQFSIALFKRLL